MGGRLFYSYLYGCSYWAPDPPGFRCATAGPLTPVTLYRHVRTGER